MKDFACDEASCDKCSDAAHAARRGAQAVLSSSGLDLRAACLFEPGSTAMAHKGLLHVVIGSVSDARRKDLHRLRVMCVCAHLRARLCLCCRREPTSARARPHRTHIARVRMCACVLCCARLPQPRWRLVWGHRLRGRLVRAPDLRPALPARRPACPAVAVGPRGASPRRVRVVAQTKVATRQSSSRNTMHCSCYMIVPAAHQRTCGL